MARIAGVNIPTAKRALIALQYIHGIGPKFAEEILERSASIRPSASTSFRTPRFCRSAK